MTDTPIPAPLTDEQIDAARDALRDAWYRSVDERIPDRAFSRWYAAVIAKAKREERERFARELNAAANERDDTHDCSFVEGIRWAALCAEVNNFD